MKVARSVWRLSFVTGVAVIMFAFLSRDEHIAQLSDVIADVDPGRAAATLATAATIVFWGSLGALAAVLLIEALLLRAVLGRHRWAQWAQLLMLLVHAGVVVFAGAFIALGDQGPLTAVLLILQLLLGGIALVASVLPGSGDWFRAGREPDHSTAV